MAKNSSVRITKMGNKYLRKLLIACMTSLVRRAKSNPETIDPRLVDLLARKPTRVATVAMANKTARIIWARSDVARSIERPPALLTASGDTPLSRSGDQLHEVAERDAR